MSERTVPWLLGVQRRDEAMHEGHVLLHGLIQDVFVIVGVGHNVQQALSALTQLTETRHSQRSLNSVLVEHISYAKLGYSLHSYRKHMMEELL